MNKLQSALAMITSQLDSDSISKNQARALRMSMGVSQAYFTRKQTTADQRRKKRKAQRAARKVTRANRR